MNILIIDTLIRLREGLFKHKDISNRLENVINKLDEHDDQIALIFEYLKQLEQSKQEETDFKNRKRIGYRQGEANM